MSLTIEETIIYVLTNNSTVNSLLGTRFFPHEIDRQSTTFPALTYYSNQEYENSLDTIGLFAWTTLSIDVWSSEYSEVVLGGKAVIKALTDYSGTYSGTNVGVILVDSVSDEVEKPQDKSATYWFSRSIDFRILHSLA